MAETETVSFASEAVRTVLLAYDLLKGKGILVLDTSKSV